MDHHSSLAQSRSGKLEPRSWNNRPKILEIDKTMVMGVVVCVLKKKTSIHAGNTAAASEGTLFELHKSILLDICVLTSAHISSSIELILENIMHLLYAVLGPGEDDPDAPCAYDTAFPYPR